MTEHNTASLLENALRDEIALYRQMLYLSEEQAQLMEDKEPDFERIAVLMDEKVHLSSEIEALEDSHRATKQEWEQTYQSYSGEVRQEVKALRDELQELLESLQELEQHTIEFLQTAEKDISQRLRNLYNSRNINRAYFHREKSPAKYINRFSK